MAWNVSPTITFTNRRSPTAVITVTDGVRSVSIEVAVQESTTPEAVQAQLVRWKKLAAQECRLQESRDAMRVAVEKAPFTIDDIPAPTSEEIEAANLVQNKVRLTQLDNEIKLGIRTADDADYVALKSLLSAAVAEAGTAVVEAVVP